MTNKLVVFAALAFVPAAIAAYGEQVHGKVSDNAGKPIRGAMVTVSSTNKSWTRFTGPDGHFDVTVPAGDYKVAVEAFGFNAKREAAHAGQAEDLSFTLTPGIQLSTLPSAELETLLPDNEETRYIRGECTVCHSFSRIQLKRGYTAQEWKTFIPTMPRGRAVPPPMPAEKLDKLTKLLEKYFGPDSTFFGPDMDPPKPEQVGHVDVSDAVLKATVREFNIPDGAEAMPISISIDGHGDAWFNERGLRANKITRFEVGPEKFDEYSASQPHHGVMGKDGLVWQCLLNGDGGPDLASVDPATGKVSFYTIPQPRMGAKQHTLAVDSKGNLWSSGDTLRKFDVGTKQYTTYKVPFPSSYPQNSINWWVQTPDDKKSLYKDSYYDVSVDSKDQVWGSTFVYGDIVRLNPVTGEVKNFHSPDTPSIRGLYVDSHDIVWFAVYDGNALGKFDQKTETFKLYHGPTKFMMPYGITEDKRNGDIWFADMNGNHITRFNPTTEKFDEFPIPSNDAVPRFPAVDANGRVWFQEYMNGKIGYVDTGEAK